MYRVSGSVKYKFGSVSPSDPNKVGLGFLTKEQADVHTNKMNCLLEDWGRTKEWNLDYWDAKPDPWITFEVVDGSN